MARRAPREDRIDSVDHAQRLFNSSRQRIARHGHTTKLGAMTDDQVHYHQVRKYYSDGTLNAKGEPRLRFTIVGRLPFHPRLNMGFEAYCRRFLLQSCRARITKSPKISAAGTTLP